MGKISQAERWILFVMLHCPPSTPSAKEASSVVLSLSLSLSLTLSLSLSSLDIVYLHQLLPPPSCIPLLLPPSSRHIQDVDHAQQLRQQQLKQSELKCSVSEEVTNESMNCDCIRTRPGRREDAKTKVRGGEKKRGMGKRGKEEGANKCGVCMIRG